MYKVNAINEANCLSIHLFLWHMQINIYWQKLKTIILYLSKNIIKAIIEWKIKQYFMWKKKKTRVFFLKDISTDVTSVLKYFWE